MPLPTCAVDDLPRILVVTGRSGAGECGVADQCARLVSALVMQGIDAVQAPVANLADLRSFVRSVSRDDVVHVSYPLHAWRKSLIPFFLLLTLNLQGHRRTALTLHEFSRAHWARRAFCIALARMADLVISTTRFEAGPLARWLRPDVQISVLPIASNIAAEKVRGADLQRRSGIVYFGLLAPGKGLEEFFDITPPLMAETCPITVAGQVVAGHDAWIQNLQARYPRAHFRLSLRPEQVSDVLHAAALAVLPYPDGISERRSSALAALAHGVQVVATRGEATTPELAEVCHLVESSDEAREVARELLLRTDKHIEASVIAHYVALRSWPAVAANHVKVYRALVSETGKSTCK